AFSGRPDIPRRPAAVATRSMNSSVRQETAKPLHNNLFGIIVAMKVVPLQLPRKEKAMLPIHTILHPTDFTEHAHYAFQMACALARDYGAKIVVLHVYPTPVAPA